MLSRALVVVLLATSLQAAPKFYQKATVIHMDTVKCLALHSDNTGMVGVLFGPAKASHTQNLYCSEYVLQGEKVFYKVQVRKAGDSVLLPIGEVVQFRFEKNHVVVRPDDSDREYEFNVVSMTLRNAQHSMAVEQEIE